MNRRRFSLQLAAAGVALPFAGHSLAQQAPFVEGRDYIRLAQPAPTSTPGKIDVLEFFWYGCPHCNAFQPAVETWSARLPGDVAFRRVPVGFSAMHETHARLFYALEALGEVDKLHRRVFAAMHVQRRRLDKESDIAAFAAEQGLDRDKFVDALRSFGVSTKARQAKALAEAYKIDGTPSMGVHGRFFTSGSLAGSNERSLQVTDFLVQTVRRGG
ncbi:MAG: thiol:disulfide interchange protein DsbA/DsbL [Gammaproteobacteria bacterium]|uniref:thiol:disulfide interchange protein DsbA/DsbL n=1 Tax=Azohydromonas sp. TaxID=1872666 RepID=UPI002C1B3B22|nr:thiol:disulfide interchange protein DsbA/DsbL [Azohydromonas sp.]HMM84958.1 thiol:disulfide interchange protein DsbA/DsbL [Azohydromonas sp.]